MPASSHRDVFALPHDGGYLVYAPLAGRVLRVNAASVRQLKTYLASGDATAVDPELVKRLGGLRWLDSPVAPVPLPADRHYHPTAVTLFLTSACNLRCTYCYAEAGDVAVRTMPEEIWRSAIDLVVRNARRAGRPAAVGFHGGGEPTVAWDSLAGAVAHARSAAGSPGNLNLGLATNGVMNEEQAEFVATTFPTVTLSLDGDAEAQDHQRPRAGGAGSFDAVMRFVDTLRGHKTSLVVRATITEATVHRQAELVEILAARTGCQLLHFEPVFARGRRAARAGEPLDADAFATGFIAAMERAATLGVRLRYSAARLGGAFLSFCGCAQDAFNVTPEGDVTACFEVCDRSSPHAEWFFFGRWDPDRGAFAIDAERLARLRGLNVLQKPLCARCFAKWSCAGDCPVKGSTESFDFQAGSARCRMNQSITHALLVQAVKGEACTAI
ncbi:MAG TPA: radical SAM protein [Thermoanaerobaculaceae bacterium]|nr:radical SAM protein [Thermoanaerobaculaceae bacterium]